MWHYYDGGTSTWRLYNGGDRLVVDNTGNVGIGTVDPGNRLDVRSDGIADTTETVLGLISDVSNRPVLQFSEWATATPHSGMSIEYDGIGATVNNKLHLRSVDAERIFTFTSGGKMGIGTTTPFEELEIAGNGRLFIGDGGGTDRKGLLIDGIEAGDYVRILPYDYGEGASMSLYFPGDVSIGTSTVATNYKLSVDGKIMAEEIKVQLSQNWPDYVFEDDYDLLSIEETAQFIEHNGHLPGMPTSADVELSEGFEVGEMNRLLLEKVEELTLYLIDQQAQIKALQSEVTQLKNPLE